MPATSRNALTELKLNGGVGAFARLFRRPTLVSRVSDLEYRTCAASTPRRSRTTAQRLLGPAADAWRRRIDTGWAARQAS